MERQYVSVHALNRYIKAVLDNDMQLQTVYIRGEISNYRPHPSGHMYFTLKDDQTESSISAIMFASQARYLKFRLRDGMKVFITAQVSVFERAGRYQLYVRSMQEDGLGNLYLRFNELKQTLEREGLFNTMHKKAIPVMPERLAILSAKQGAALQDVLRTLHQRYPLVRRDIYPVPVQGRDAYKYIVETLRQVDQLGYSTILLVRGGGSIEELWNFNEEALAEEIFHSEIPIISAVGHEVDYTIADFVADLRASTPSQAGELAVPLDSEIYFTISEYENYLNKYMIERFNDEKSKINNFSRILSLNSPMNKVVNSYLEVEKVKEKLDSLLNKKIALEKQKLISLNNVLQAHSPLNILSKGYAIIEDENGNILKEIKDFNKDMNVKINLSDGIIKGNLKLL